MIRIRRALERGHTQIEWLDSFHTFSFGGYHDPRHSGFHDLIVINDDHISPKSGFGFHSHRDMEIITYMLDGTLEHQDSLGNVSSLRKGQLQRMSAGTGVRHSEKNASATDPLHLLQIWIKPSVLGLKPSYEEISLTSLNKHSLTQVAGELRDESSPMLHINSNTHIFLGSLTNPAGIKYQPLVGRHVWIQMITGSAAVNGQPLHSGDGAAVEKETEIEFQSENSAEFLLFDLP